MAKVAIVIGAGQGIGLAIAKRLHADGYKIGIVDYNEETANKAVAEFPEGDAFAAGADVSKQDQLLSAFEAIADYFGDLNVVVNNAGVAPASPLDTITPEKFAQVFGINVAGVIWGAQAAHKLFKKFGHGGRIINAASQAGILGNPELTLYSGSKFAVRGITQVLARDLAEEDITVTAYAPGIVKTPMMFGIAHEVAVNAGKDDDWGMDQFAKDITLKRLSEPEDIANVVSFLAGPDSTYITGQTIVVDGGMVFH